MNLNCNQIRYIPQSVLVTASNEYGRLTNDTIPHICSHPSDGDEL